MAERTQQVLELPSMGPMQSPARPGKESIFSGAVEVLRQSPYAVTRSERNRGRFYSGQECCDCPSGPQAPGDPRGQPPGFWPGPQGQNPGLFQPRTPQMPFQPSTNDPCQFTREALMKLGITPEMINACVEKRSKPKGKKRSTPARSKSPARSKKPRGKKMTKSRYYPGKKPKRKRKSPVMTRGNYQVLSNGACWDPRTRKFVKRSKCA